MFRASFFVIGGFHRNKMGILKTYSLLERLCLTKKRTLSWQ